jgi:hypothetical protein
MRFNSMIQLSDLNDELVAVTIDQLGSVHGGDSFGAAIGGGSGFAAAGVVSGGDLRKAVNGGAAGASVGNLIPVATNPSVGIPTAAFLGTAVGVAQAFSATAAKYYQQANSSGGKNFGW